MGHREQPGEDGQTVSSTSSEEFADLWSANTTPRRNSDAMVWHLAQTIPQNSTQPLDWTSMPCVGDEFIRAAELPEDDDEFLLGCGSLLGGEVIGARFRLVDEVHHGLMGSVWLAIDETTRAKVAVKLVPRELAPTLDAQDLAALTRASSHPGLVTLIEHGRHGSWWYQVATWMEGQTLESLLRTNHGRALVAANLESWMRQLSEALEAHHRAGFVHGDVKAANVLVTVGGRICLIDLVGLRIGASWRRHGGLTSAFASPQAHAGAPADPRDDVYGLAAMMSRLLAAESASPCNARAQVQPRLTRSQSIALRKALDPDRERRTESATALVHALWPAPVRETVRRAAGQVAALRRAVLQRRSGTAWTGRGANGNWFPAAAAAAVAAVLVAFGSSQLRSLGGTSAGVGLTNSGVSPPSAAESQDERAPLSGRRLPHPILPAADVAAPPTQWLTDKGAYASAPRLGPMLDAVVERTSPMSTGAEPARRSLGGAFGRQSHRPETLSFLSDASVWVSAGDAKQADDKKYGASGATLSAGAQAERRNKDQRDEADESEGTLASSDNSVSSVSNNTTTAPGNRAAGPGVALPEPASMDRAPGESMAGGSALLASLDPLLAVTAPATPQFEQSTSQDVAVPNPSPVLTAAATLDALVEPLSAALSTMPVTSDLPLISDVPAVLEVAVEPVVAVLSTVTAIPDVPVVPNVPSLPVESVAAVLSTVTAIPDVPVVPNVPSLPVESVAAVLSTVTAIPDVPVVPNVPVLPEIPIVSDLPTVPVQLELPTLGILGL